MRKILAILATILAFTLALQSASPVLASGLTASRYSGSPGTSLTVYGSSFSVNETGIVVTWNGSAITSGITADSTGGWSSTFLIPAAASGSYIIDAYGSTTPSTNVTDVSFSVIPGISLSPSSGPSGTTVTVTGSGFSASETGITVTYDSSTVASSITANSLGGWSATFQVPVSASGSHTVDAYGTVSLATSVADVSFSITSGITLNPSSGSPRSTVTVTGSGFVASETVTVTFDGTQVTSGIVVNTQGNWTATFVIPAASYGTHTIDAYGTITPATSVGDKNFSITAGITISPTSGTPGIQITVTGSAFGTNESSIAVTYDGTTVVSGISANPQGGWSASFVVPASVSGTHILDAYGSITQGTTVSDLNFTVEPSIGVNKTSGSTGTSINIIGAGFSASDRNIAVLYDGTPAASGIVANNQGGWTAAFIVPASTAGSHVISAQGSVTLASSIDPVSFNAEPSISLNPAFGGVGTLVEISGSGFASKSNLSFSFGSTALSSEGAVTDTKGSFSKSITVPNLKFGSHIIRVVDAQRNESSLTFTMESTPPPSPRSISPQDGANSGITGGATPTLKWSSVTDPSGVTYTVQIDVNPDFVQPVLEKSGLAGTSYTLTKMEALPYGQYYWRVRAVDGASNASAWTQGWALKSGILPLGALIGIIVAVIIALVVLFVLIRLLSRKPAPTPAPEITPQMIFGQWREVEPEEVQRPRALPWRRAALPAPKTVRTLSAEDQARLKVVADFAQSLPLVEPGYTADWIIDMMRSSMGIDLSSQSCQQILRGEMPAHFEPPWTRHPLYLELKTLLEGQSILQDLSGYVDTVSVSASEALAILQDICREASAEATVEVLAKGNFKFVFGVYSDALSWFRGKSLEEPSERDYSIAPIESGDGTVIWLSGQSGSVFAGPLVPAADEAEAVKLRTLHLRLRRTYRNNERAKQLVSMIAKLEVQRTRLLSALGQLGNAGGEVSS